MCWVSSTGRVTISEEPSVGERTCGEGGEVIECKGVSVETLCGIVDGEPDDRGLQYGYIGGSGIGATGRSGCDELNGEVTGGVIGIGERSSV